MAEEITISSGSSSPVDHGRHSKRQRSDTPGTSSHYSSGRISAFGTDGDMKRLKRELRAAKKRITGLEEYIDSQTEIEKTRERMYESYKNNLRQQVLLEKDTIMELEQELEEMSENLAVAKEKLTCMESQMKELRNQNELLRSQMINPNFGIPSTSSQIQEDHTEIVGISTPGAGRTMSDGERTEGNSMVEMETQSEDIELIEAESSTPVSNCEDSTIPSAPRKMSASPEFDEADREVQRYEKNHVEIKLQRKEGPSLRSKSTLLTRQQKGKRVNKLSEALLGKKISFKIDRAAMEGQASTSHQEFGATERNDQKMTNLSTASSKLSSMTHEYQSKEAGISSATSVQDVPRPQAQSTSQGESNPGHIEVNVGINTSATQVPKCGHANRKSARAAAEEVQLETVPVSTLNVAVVENQEQLPTPHEELDAGGIDGQQLSSNKSCGYSSKGGGTSSAALEQDCPGLQAGAGIVEEVHPKVRSIIVRRNHDDYIIKEAKEGPSTSGSSSQLNALAVSPSIAPVPGSSSDSGVEIHSPPEVQLEEYFPTSQEQEDKLMLMASGKTYCFLVSKEILEIDWKKCYSHRTNVSYTNKWACKKCKEDFPARQLVEDHVWYKHLKGKYFCPHCIDIKREVIWRNLLPLHAKDYHPDLHESGAFIDKALNDLKLELHPGIKNIWGKRRRQRGGE